MDKFIFVLNIHVFDLNLDDEINDQQFIEKGRKLTIEELVYNLNNDFIASDMNWFRIITKEAIEAYEDYKKGLRETP